ncbi:TonB-dependent receptor [Chryseobacterium sp.]|uniref:TonB-dependent receptor n=1 Tax=Chryseobacterium sp. TaxID=1871047 RepID=UPI0025BA8C4F|nr:TonB-dependent receptor [Chryseobacterium sp.]MBV8326777.1 TonB-dependent receptor [Chryseobacterium sp.]
MKHFRILLFSFLVLFLNSKPLFGQQYTLKGQVVDKEKKPIEWVKANIFRNDTLVAGGITTDSAGLFTIRMLKGNYKLVLERFGKEYYHQKINILRDYDLGKIEINESILLEGVTITGNRKIVERQFDKVIFNVSNSPLKQGYNGLEILKRSPGLRVNSKGEILLRNENVMVMVNGRKMNFSASELENYLNGLNSENIKSIEIQTLGSADTDASNSGGVVNIVLKKIPVGFQSTIKTSYAYRDKDHAGYTGGVTSQFGAAKWNIYNKINYSDNTNLSRFNSTTNFFNTQGKNVNYGESDNHNKNFNMTTGVFFYPSKQHEIGAEVYFSNTKVHRDGWENLMVYNPSHSSTSDNRSLYENKNNFWNATLNYVFKLNDKGSSIKFIGDAGNTQFDNNNEVDSRYTYGSLPDNYYRYLTDANSNFVNLQTDWHQKSEKNWEWTLGVKYAQVRRNNLLNVFLNDDGAWNPASGDQDFDNKEQVLSNYITVAKQWEKRHNLKIGLRTEYTDLTGTDNINATRVKRSYFDWFPNLYYGYTLADNQSISVSYARRINRPSFRDLNPFVIKQNDFLFQTGNPDLQPQYTSKIDLSYTLKNHTFSLFGSFSDNIIAGVYSVQGNITYYKPENFGKSQTVGLYHSFNGNLAKWLYTSISSGVWYYNFEIGDISHNRFSFYTTWSLQVKFDKTFFLDITNDYNTKSQSNAVEFYDQYGLDLALQKSILQGSGIIRLSWDDVFNTQRDRNISRYENFDFHFYQKRITSYPTLTFTYNIKNKSKINNKNIQKGNDNINRL